MKLNIFVLFVIIAIFSCRSIPTESGFPVGKTTKISNEKYTGFLFDEKSTTIWMSAQSEVQFKQYWSLSEDSIFIIDNALVQYVEDNFEPNIAQQLPLYIRQYFPFINMQNEKVAVVTLSIVKENGPSRDYIIENLGKYYRSVFDSTNDTYFSVILYPERFH